MEKSFNQSFLDDLKKAMSDKGFLDKFSNDISGGIKEDLLLELANYYLRNRHREKFSYNKDAVNDIIELFKTKE